MVVSGICNALTALCLAILLCLLHTMHDPGFFDSQRAGDAFLCLLQGILPLLLVAQLDWASVRTVLLQVIPV